jgi:hypothetical protein
MILTIKTYAKFISDTRSLNFKEVYGWARMNARIEVDLVEWGKRNEIGFECTYEGVVFGIKLIQNNADKSGEFVISYFYKKIMATDEDYNFTQYDIYEVDGYEIDWCNFFHGCYYALNNHSKEFENCSGIKKFVYLSTEAREIMNIHESKCDDLADYIIYDETHEKVGYVIVIEDQE